MSDVEAPQSLRKAVKTFHTDLEYIIHSNDMDPEFIGDCLWCAARMHKDAPNVIWNILLDVTKQEHWSLTEDIMLGSALGNFSLPQQKALHKTLLDLCKNKPKNRKYLSILSQAYWRCPSTVSQLDEQEINTLVNALYREFKHRLQKKDDRHFPYNITTMCELLLALLRTRGSDNPEIKNILDANGENSKKFKEIIDNIINIQQEKKFPMKSFIQLELKKPDTRKTMPDLLYAVDMYLTGEDGTDDIVITGVKDAASDE